MANLTSENDSDDDYPVPHDIVSDNRMNVLNVDSKYCDLDNIDSSMQTFSRSKYCAMHINIHSLPSKYEQLRDMLSRLKNQKCDRTLCAPL